MYTWPVPVVSSAASSLSGPSPGAEAYTQTVLANSTLPTWLRRAASQTRAVPTTLISMVPIGSAWASLTLDTAARWKMASVPLVARNRAARSVMSTSR